jgi:hypothetical protein
VEQLSSVGGFAAAALIMIAAAALITDAAATPIGAEGTITADICHACSAPI